MSESIRILVVDDDPDFARLTRCFIEHLGFEAFIAGNGKEAVALYLQEQPHAVLMDINMPIMNGIEATAAILAEDFEASIAFVSVLDEFPEGTPPEIAQAFEIYEKPNSLADMRRILEALLTLRTAR